MTTAPANLLAARKLLIDHLGPDAKPLAGVTILDPLGDPAWEVGIVGDASHIGGYHAGSDRVRRVNGQVSDYSVTESSRDRAGLSIYASALDVGMFKVRTPLGVFDLRHYSRWLVEQCKAGTADTRHLREVIYSPDGKVVKRWDRLGRRSTGDSSHLSHTHESSYRDAGKADAAAVKRRYLQTIGVIAAPATVEDDMSEKASQAIEAWSRGNPKTSTGTSVEPVLWRIRDESWQKKTDATMAAVLGAVQGLDTKAILARIDQVAAAESARDAEMAELIRAGQSGELAVDELLRRLGEVLTAGTSPVPGQARE